MRSSSLASSAVKLALPVLPAAIEIEHRVIVLPAHLAAEDVLINRPRVLALHPGAAVLHKVEPDEAHLVRRVLEDTVHFSGDAALMGLGVRRLHLARVVRLTNPGSPALRHIGTSDRFT